MNMDIDTMIPGQDRNIRRTTKLVSFRMDRGFVEQIDALRAEFDRRAPHAPKCTRTDMFHVICRTYLDQVRQLRRGGQSPEPPERGYNPDATRDLVMVAFRVRIDYLHRMDQLCATFDTQTDSDLPTRRSDVFHAMTAFFLSEAIHALDSGDDNRLRQMHDMSKDW